MKKEILLILFTTVCYLSMGQIVNQIDKNGKKQGLWIEDDGLTEGYYKDDLPNGIFRYYHKKNHTLYSFGEFEQGEEIGNWYYFNETGAIICKISDIKNNENKIIILDDGVTKKKPLKESYAIFYYPSGSIKSEGVVLYDEDFEENHYKYGLWEYYDEKGVLTKTESR